MTTIPLATRLRREQNEWIESGEYSPYIDQIIEELGFPVAKEEEIVGTSRWSTIHRMVIEDGNEYFQVTWTCPATEMQEGSDEHLEWTVKKVVPVERVVIDFEPAREG